MSVSGIVVSVVIGIQGPPGPPAPVRLVFGTARAVAILTGKIVSHIRQPLMLSDGVVHVDIAPVGADITGNIRKNGTTTIGTFTIPAGQKDGIVTITSGSLVNGDQVSKDVTQVGSAVSGSHLSMTIFGTYT